MFTPTPTREQMARLHFDARVANKRLAARMQDIDHIAERAWCKKHYSYLRYKNLLRCPKTVFANYGW